MVALKALHTLNKKKNPKLGKKDKANKSSRSLCYLINTIFTEISYTNFWSELWIEIDVEVLFTHCRPSKLSGSFWKNGNKETVHSVLNIIPVGVSVPAGSA